MRNIGGSSALRSPAPMLSRHSQATTALLSANVTPYASGVAVDALSAQAGFLAARRRVTRNRAYAALFGAGARKPALS